MQPPGYYYFEFGVPDLEDKDAYKIILSGTIPSRNEHSAHGIIKEIVQFKIKDKNNLPEDYGCFIMTRIGNIEEDIENIKKKTENLTFSSSDWKERIDREKRFTIGEDTVSVDLDDIDKEIHNKAQQLSEDIARKLKDSKMINKENRKVRL